MGDPRRMLGVEAMGAQAAEETDSFLGRCPLLTLHIILLGPGGWLVSQRRVRFLREGTT